MAGLSGGQVTEDRREYSLTLCPKCDDLFMPALEKLCGFDGFGTDAI